jgi:hypothetical protein
MFWSPRLLGTFTTLPFLFSNTLLLRLCLFRCKTFFVKRFHHLRVFVSLYNDSQTTNQFRLPENSLVKHKKLFTKFFFRKPFSNLLPTPHPTPSALSLSLSPNPCYCSPSPYLLFLAKPSSLLLLSIARSSFPFPLCHTAKTNPLLRSRTANPHPPSSISHGKPQPPFVSLRRSVLSMSCQLMWWLVVVGRVVHGLWVFKHR